MAHSLTESEAERLRKLLVQLGPEEVAKRFQLNTTTLLRAAVGLPGHNATMVVITQRLNDVEA